MAGVAVGSSGVRLRVVSNFGVAMAIVVRAKYTRARESSRRRDAKGAPIIVYLE